MCKSCNGKPGWRASAAANCEKALTGNSERAATWRLLGRAVLHVIWLIIDLYEDPVSAKNCPENLQKTFLGHWIYANGGHPPNRQTSYI
jgi:hypothetical protein